jgi:tetratricopeptide (TPR) repeat protein
MRKRGMVPKAAAVVVTILLSAGLALAQAGRGKARISGAVLDGAGNPVPGAKVVAVFEQEEASSFDAVAGRDGKWAIIGIGTGNWTITASAKGYLPVSVSVSVKQLERNAAINITLDKQAGGSGVVQDESSFEALEQANGFYNDGKYDTALVMYEEFLSKNPGAYQVQLNIGDCYREKGEYDKAVEIYDKLVEQSKSDSTMGKMMGAKGLAAIGLCFLKRQNFEQAQDYFKKSIEMSPQDENLPYNVAEIYFSNQNIEEALRYFEMASQIKPDWPDPYYKLAMVYLNKGDMAKATESLEKFIKLEPDTERTAQAEGILKAIKK